MTDSPAGRGIASARVPLPSGAPCGMYAFGTNGSSGVAYRILLWRLSTPIGTIGAIGAGKENDLPVFWRLPIFS